MNKQELINLIDERILQMELSLIDDRIDMKTDIIMESDWFQEQVELAVKTYLEEQSVNNKEFIEEVYEIAFGDNAINREFTQQDVLDQLRQFSDDSCEKHEGDA
mgnify:CR=1 FL=1